jgi:hypothetical protein
LISSAAKRLLIKQCELQLSQKLAICRPATTIFLSATNFPVSSQAVFSPSMLLKRLFDFGDPGNVPFNDGMGPCPFLFTHQ